ncbi:uncharacterized protein [Rutidosis leptorrhynchoides]|uniref:uncharacterized protein isoform X2 n=1 Tax=Rutidosis leptorrhynchoides TaxID=125765 RepID=UPI003A99642C
MSITMSSGHVESSQSLESLHPCHQFTIADIQLLTDNFDESLVIGRGGFGKVYRGTITDGVTRLDVAVKRLDTTSNQGALEFWAEVKMLTKLRHCHLVSLIGYCNDIREMILVYEFMPRGTLEDHLHKLRAPLTWVRRLKICIGAARGLDYLHTGTGINHGVIHRDVKSSNILLDDTWGAKISDFGLSKISPINQSDTGVNTLVKFTFGYLDPDYYQTGRVTRKSDVYAFGVVLFEVLCEKRAVDKSLDKEQWNLARWAQDSIKEGRLKQIVDHNIRGKISSRCLKEFAQLAVGCLHSHPKQRPTMSQVVFALECILALQEKQDDKLRAGGMTIFGKKIHTFVFQSNKENSVGVEGLNSVELYLSTLQDENQQLRRFHFDTIQVATENFSASNRVSDGGNYSMYKGRLQNGHKITVLSPYYDIMIHKELIINEVSLLVKLKHKNLIELVGYCIEGDMVYLIYDFALHATLRSTIHDPVCTLLDWNKRYQILLVIARALVYLHNQAPDPIIHCDVRPGNIALDERFYPKLFKFRETLQIDRTDCTYVDVFWETWEHMAPEYIISGCVSTKVDVYSFGVLVLETITGREAWKILPSIKWGDYQALKILLPERISNIIDPRIAVDASSIETFIKIGLWCIVPDPVLRPTMEEVVDMFLDESSVSLFLQKQEEGLLEWYSHNINVKHNDHDIVAADDDYDTVAAGNDYDTVAADNDYDTVASDDFRQELCPR